MKEKEEKHHASDFSKVRDVKTDLRVINAGDEFLQEAAAPTIILSSVTTTSPTTTTTIPSLITTITVCYPTVPTTTSITTIIPSLIITTTVCYLTVPAIITTIANHPFPTTTTTSFTISPPYSPHQDIYLTPPPSRRTLPSPAPSTINNVGVEEDFTKMMCGVGRDGKVRPSRSVKHRRSLTTSLGLEPIKVRKNPLTLPHDRMMGSGLCPMIG
ncbi:hypothetical protein Hamer_G003240 [Homarus americanus]|uniref:Uncharacterized protein n=1 Tax=Homarus americanus TaxID=6706 RepID=A0A8J5N733_HOMAM|nr:hypothetical protein Hamer_G003240 [Homarus americanus]